MVKKNLELLSPGKNADYGRAAIDHGADAVYIGAPRYGARSAAGNSLDDIARLIEYAHLFRCRVYVAVNTVLYDKELDDVRNLIYQLYTINADAIIIQDTAILAMDLPPIPLHASTQMHNVSAERIHFLEQAGIERVILARELSPDEIRSIHSATCLELESFVHGALCVSYSGQCYMSCSAGGRSANRGECAQPCRKLYNLADSTGRSIIENRHLLSLKDMQRDMYLSDLVAAGVTSFKIEGRLKDLSYVKNVTAHYRKKLDRLIADDATLARSSAGMVNLFFEPDPEKTFNRGYTDYFYKTTETLLAGTSKSLGKKIGLVRSVRGNVITMGSEPLSSLTPGDGLCFFDSTNALRGFRVERTTRDGYEVSEPTLLTPGTILYRNHDHMFEKTLEGKSAQRTLPVTVEFREVPDGYEVLITDDEGNGVRAPLPGHAATARDTDRSRDTICNQLEKLGDTPFKAQQVIISVDKIPFFPVSALNEARRKAVLNLIQVRMDRYTRPIGVRAPFTAVYPEQKLDYHGNITNAAARGFYRDHGCHADDGFELITSHEGLEVMTTKMCLLRELGWCKREGNKLLGSEPLFLEDDISHYTLEFDCTSCVMRIIYQGRIK